MRLAHTEDQALFVAALDAILADSVSGFRAVPGWGRWEYGTALDAMLDQNGFFEAAREPTLGAVAAVELVMRLAARPVAVEGAASALLRPLLGVDLPRPLAVIDGDPGVVRFAPQARSVLWLGETLRAARLPEGAAIPGETIFAWPVGAIDPARLDWHETGAAAVRARTLWQLGQAAELVGSLTGGLETVLAHVRDRQQFGRPLGAFQGVQHRLAAGAVQMDAARWLVLKAAATGAAADTLLALGQAQRAAGQMLYDLHQFMGAMGLTLEHPLHRFTYRAKMLRSVGGGAAGQMRAFADHRWGMA